MGKMSVKCRLTTFPVASLRTKIDVRETTLVTWPELNFGRRLEKYANFEVLLVTIGDITQPGRKIARDRSLGRTRLRGGLAPLAIPYVPVWSAFGEILCTRL